MGVIGLRIDFAAGPRNRSRARLAGSLAIASVVLYMAYNQWHKADEAVSVPAAPVASVQAPSERVSQAAERVRREVAAPWGRLFDALEQAATKEVTLLSLESSVADGTAAIDAEALDVVAMASYMALLASRGLERSVIVRQQPVVGTDRIRFSVATQWVAGRDEKTEPASLALADLPITGDVGLLSAEWLAQAKVAGLTVRNVDHEWTQAADKTRYASLGFDISGDYRAARDFVNRAVGARTGIALHQFSLRVLAGGEPQPAGLALQGRIVLRVFTREAA